MFKILNSENFLDKTTLKIRDKEGNVSFLEVKSNSILKKHLDNGDRVYGKILGPSKILIIPIIDGGKKEAA